MSTMNNPSAGRMVHFFPNGNGVYVSRAIKTKVNTNNAPLLPATVVQTFGGLKCNLSVFVPDAEFPVVTLFSVNHKSEAKDNESYWDWPEIVR